MKPYDHKDIEKKWQDTWQEQSLYKTPDHVPGKENYYTLVEFSYPSGNLHVGHWYAFSVPDIFARYKRMQGYNVLYPMGFDAFGLPAENAAIKLGKDPKKWTYEHMESMRAQLRSMGTMFDWSREVVSCDPAYYKWTQWMFTEFFKHDLAYRATTTVNWCEHDQTILANEQVIDGVCDRCGNQVIQRPQEQWMFRITQFADALVDDLDTLDWPDSIKESQKNWIGRSEGSEIEFGITDSENKITVFTTRADTLFGVTYVVLAPEYPLVSQLLDQVTNKNAVVSYIESTKKKLELDRQQSKEKTGVCLEGIFAINPANNEQVPVWIADYVLPNYGTGAVMAVPAHDERDFEFAKKYELPMKEVILTQKNHGSGAFLKTLEGKFLFQKRTLDAPTSPGKIVTFGGARENNENPIECLKRELKEELELVISNNDIVDSIFYQDSKGDHIFFLVENVDESQLILHEGEAIISFNSLEDALQSKDFCENQKKAILQLQNHNQFCFIETGTLKNSSQFNGLTSQEAKQKITEFVGGKMVKTYRLRDWGISRQRYWGCPIPIVYDPQGNAHPVPAEHLPWLLPDDVDHTPDGTPPLARSRELFERTEKIFGKGWTPEVETMDTFVDSSWYFYRYLDNTNDHVFADKEKITQWMPIDLYMGGAEHTTMHVLYSRFWVKALQSIGLVDHSEAYKIRRNRGLILGPDGNKMSKSKGNVINPDEVVGQLGADTVRLYLAFMGPYGVTINYPWDPNGVVGVRRFLERVWKASFKISNSDKVSSLIHKTIKGVGEDIAEYKFNTAISKMMILINYWDTQKTIASQEYKMLLQILAPFAPHMTEELWHTLGETQSIHISSWPVYDPKLLVEDMITLGVQINGKVRAEIEIAIDASESEVHERVLLLPEVIKWLEGKEVKKFIYIPKKIISIVVS